MVSPIILGAVYRFSWWNLKCLAAKITRIVGQTTGVFKAHFFQTRAKPATNYDKLWREAEKEVRRRKIDGCPIAGALQLIGDKWTLLVVRELFQRPKRTTELLEELHPISSRTLMGRLKEMEQDELILRINYGGLPRRVEYELTERGRRLVPLLDALMKTGQVLDCNDCEDRKQQLGYYCDCCPNVRPAGFIEKPSFYEVEPGPAPEPAPSRRPKDDSIVLL